MVKRTMLRGGVAAILAAVGVGAIWLAPSHSTVGGYYAIGQPTDVLPYRASLWWLFAAAVAVALTVFACAVLELRQRARVLVRAVIDVALPLAVLTSGAAVGAFVYSTRSTTVFECIIASPILVWAPAVCSAVATAGFVTWQRYLGAPPN